jgi:hypothetical protein
VPSVVPEGGYGLTSIPVEERSYLGEAVKADTIFECLKIKLAQPLATIQSIANQTGLSWNTVSKALKTPYALRMLPQKQDIEVMAQELNLATMDTVGYWRNSVHRGNAEITAKTPQPAILTNARECGRDIAKATGLLSDQHTVRHELRSQRGHNVTMMRTRTPYHHTWQPYSPRMTRPMRGRGNRPPPRRLWKGESFPMTQKSLNSLPSLALKAGHNAEE